MKTRAMTAVLFLLCVCMTQPALAHRLRLYAHVDDGVVSGFAFFVGGGRARYAEIFFRDASGRNLHVGRTDHEGAFVFTPSQPQDVVIIVNSGDGHAAEASLPLERFAARATPQAQPESEPVVQGEAGAPLLIDTGSALRPADLSLIERKVEAAVARQIGPLLEAYTLAEGRVRFNDVMGGIGMITGLAGIALWASSRRRRDGGQS